jgi:hypothetical protein
MVERDRALMPYSLYRIAFGLTILAVLTGRPASVVESSVDEHDPDPER